MSLKKSTIVSFFDLFKFTIFVLTIICIFCAIVSDVLMPYWLLSVSYMLFILFSKHNIVKKAPGIIVLNVIMFFRYIMLPLAIYVSNGIYGYYRNLDYISDALIIMIYEQISVFIAIDFTGRKNDNRIEFIPKCAIPRLGSLVALCAVFLLLLLYKKDPALLGGVELITKGSITKQFDTENISGIVGILWQACLSWLYMYFNLKIKKFNIKREETGKSEVLYPALVLSLSYIFISFIGQSRISRWYTIIITITILFTLISLYPSKIKKLCIIIGVPVIVLMAIVTVYKNSSYLSGSGSFKDSLLGLINSSTFNAYFAGPLNVNNAIGAHRDLNLNIRCLFGDVVNNMPIVNHWFDTSGNTVSQFNQYIGRWWGNGGDQIIPLVGQSLIYFSELLAPLLSVMSVFIIRYLDNKYLKSTSMMTFLYIFTSSWTACATVLNFTIYLSWVYVRVFPLFVMIKVIDGFGSVNIKKGNKNY